MSMKAVRLKEMELYLAEYKTATIEELCNKFEIHPNTARSDVKELAEKGVIQRSYGRVDYVATNPLVSFVDRQHYNHNEKIAIGKAAVELLVEDDIIYVDAGTTTLTLFQKGVKLPDNLTVVSHNLDVINWVVQNTEYNVFVLPGKVNRKLNAFASLETIESLKTYNIKKAFIGTRGISSKGELSSTSSIDAKLKRTAIEISETVVLMADSRKLNNTALFNFSNLSEIDFWACEHITDEISDACKQANIKLLCQN